jgi:hypothetical protein
VRDAGVGLFLDVADPTVIQVGFCPVSGSCDPGCTNVTAYGTPPRPAGRQIRVCATYTYQPLFSGLVVGPLTLEHQAQVRSE